MTREELRQTCNEGCYWLERKYPDEPPTMRPMLVPRDDLTGATLVMRGTYTIYPLDQIPALMAILRQELEVKE